MNKWIIFIIVVIVISIVGVGANFLTSSTSSNVNTTEEVAVQQDPDPVIRITNISEYSISQGVLVIHDSSFSMNFLGIQPPEAYKSLAEEGDPSAALTLLRETPAVSGLIEIPEINPRSTHEITIPLESIKGEEGYARKSDARISYMAMIREIDDSVVWLNGYTLYSAESKQTQEGKVVTEIIDMGTSTNEPARHHQQFYEGDITSNEVVQITIDK